MIKATTAAILLSALSFGLLGPEGKYIKFALTHPLKPRHCDPSRHGCLRHDQIERKRKTTRRMNRATFKRYRRKSA